MQACYGNCREIDNLILWSKVERSFYLHLGYRYMQEVLTIDAIMNKHVTRHWGDEERRCDHDSTFGQLRELTLILSILR